jgi:TolB-like protein/AraC-like DNA-binding protein/Tfp pilus assembly protein PilF
MAQDFLDKITEIVEDNISNEQFGVSELARDIGMSRSNLLRKIKKLTNLSVSQYISQIRLKKAMELLKQNSFTVSEVSFRVGFSSTSYFIKCFREFYGYPPGETGKMEEKEKVEKEKEENVSVAHPADLSPGKGIRLVLALVGVLLVVSALILLVFKPFSPGRTDLEKSIAVLPFSNDSNDSSNIYFINGLMESILGNLQQVEDLRVISRTSVEKYRMHPKTAPEIARELRANYLVEGSGQKIGDQIFLNIQLIEAASDKHLWAEQYISEAKDVFQLQIDVAKSIVAEIEAIITPEEEERIEKPPTEDLLAYDYFLKGRDHFFEETTEGLLDAIPFFEKAIEQDPEFARAYANLAISYALLDIYQIEKKYADRVIQYADRALLLDPKLAQSLIAKAFTYMVYAEYEMALPFLEKALLYNPNSAMVINILSDFYTRFVQDTEKYLEYALKGIQLDIAAQDSVAASYIFMHVGNAFIQTGFVEEAELYIDKALDYNDGNSYAYQLKAYILFAKNKDLQQLKDLLSEAFSKDSSRYDIVEEIGMIYYYLRDFENAYRYYTTFLEYMEAQNLEISRGSFAKIGVVFSELGFKEKADKYFSDFLVYAEADESMYQHLSLAVYYSYMGNTNLALEHLELFSHEDKYPYWYLLFLDIDPLFDNIQNLPEFQEILKDIESNYWDNHQLIRASLRKKDLLR